MPDGDAALRKAPAERANAKSDRVAVLWKFPNLGLYSNAGLEFLYNGIGHNNGNLAFVYAVVSHIKNPVKFFGWSTPAATLREHADIIVIPCANQLGKHTDYGDMATNLAKAGLPVVAIGLGAQADSYDRDIALTEGTKRWAETIARSNASPSSNIYTRGAYTTAQLDKLGITGSITGGCPSYFINQAPGLGQTIATSWSRLPLPRSISVCAGHQAWLNTRRIEHQLIALMMDPVAPGQYVVQSMAEMVKISRGVFDDIDPQALRAVHDHTVPHYSTEEFRTWCRNYVRSFYDVPAWMDSLRRYDLAIGTRYHGVALALQAGQMGLTITIDSRTRELCENTGVPHIEAAKLTSPITRTSLKNWLSLIPMPMTGIERRLLGNMSSSWFRTGSNLHRSLRKLPRRRATRAGSCRFAFSPPSSSWLALPQQQRSTARPGSM